MNRDDIIRLGEGAKRILNDESVTAAFEAVLEDLRYQWAESRPDDVTGREGCYRMVGAVKLLVAKLHSFAGNAQLEISNLEARQRETHGLH